MHGNCTRVSPVTFTMCLFWGQNRHSNVALKSAFLASYHDPRPWSNQWLLVFLRWCGNTVLPQSRQIQGRQQLTSPTLTEPGYFCGKSETYGCSRIVTQFSSHGGLEVLSGINVWLLWRNLEYEVGCAVTKNTPVVIQFSYFIDKKSIGLIGLINSANESDEPNSNFCISGPPPPHRGRFH